MTTKHRLTGALRTAAALTATALALTACGQGGNLEPDDVPVPDTTDTVAPSETPGTDEGEPGEAATIRFSWWGSDVRHRMNQELIEVFEEQNPAITVIPDFTDWGGYWDKLATQAAAGEAPDVIMMDMNYIREYADRDQLANLHDHAVDTSDIDPALLGSGELDGNLWGLPTGGNVISWMADPQTFADAGVEMPDDVSWTWDEFHDTMVQITENTPDGVFGAQSVGIADNHLMIWLRQHGQDLWSADGGLAFEPEVLADYWERLLALMEDGGSPPASMAVEIDAGGPEQSLVATNRGGVSMYWTNQLSAVSTAAGRELVLLRFPGESEFTQPGLYVKASMLLTMSSNTAEPEAAATFIDWMQNSTEAGEIILSDRGLPSNLVVREHILEQLPELEQQAAEFIEGVSANVADAPPAPPPAASQVLDLLGRINEEVLFGQTTPQEAAERFVQEASSIIGD